MTHLHDSVAVSSCSESFPWTETWARVSSQMNYCGWMQLFAGLLYTHMLQTSFKHLYTQNWEKIMYWLKRLHLCFLLSIIFDLSGFYGIWKNMKEKQLNFIQRFKLSKNMNLLQMLILIWAKIWTKKHSSKAWWSNFAYS